jgi:hypothetical protein
MWLILLASILALGLGALPLHAEPFANAAAVLELGMGVRVLALGGAFVGLADDESSLFYNPAGLAWNDGLSLLSTYEVRPLTAGYGHISAVRGNLGLGIHYFDFGNVPETDEFGNIVGTFSYRNLALVAGAGVSASNLPYLSSMPLAESVAFGLGVKLLNVDTLAPGNGIGFAVDLPFLVRIDSPQFGQPYITQFAFGVLLQNVLGMPISYESGHSEDWIKKVVMGSSVEVASQLIVDVDLASDNSIHLGLEWSPVSALSVRLGLKREGVWTGSMGIGTLFRNMAFDLALVAHPYLHNQIRGSFGVYW